MKRAIVDPEKCAKCTECAVEKNCKRNAVIREAASDTPWIDFYLCNGCLNCKSFCVNEAIGEIVKPCTGGGQKGW